MEILILVSGRANAKPAVEFGGRIAELTESNVTLLEIAKDTRELSKADIQIERAKGMLPNMKVNSNVRKDTYTNGVLAETKAHHYDMVVTSARQNINLLQKATGMVGRAIARQAPTSVLIVKEMSPKLEHILICTSGQKVAENAIELGAKLAKAAHAKITLMHVTNPVPSMYTGLDEIEETLAELLQTDTPLAIHLRAGAKTLSDQGVDAELKLRHGVVADEILHEAHLNDYDLIILGATGVPSKVRGWLLGDVTREIVDQAKCPVLIVKAPKES